MAVARQSVVFPQRRSRRPTVSPLSSRRKSSPHQLSNVPSINRSQRLERLPNSQPIPLWLRVMLQLKRSSDLVSFLLIAATLTTYAWTVYTQQLWSREYRKLETLQRHERQMTTTNEALKNQLAQEAERPGTGLVSPNPANTIFLPPAPQRQSLPKSATATTIADSSRMPLGY